jgi:hypothetical protein
VSALGTIAAAAAVAIATTGTAVTFVLAVLYTIHPGEECPDHPKRLILKDDR